MKNSLLFIILILISFSFAGAVECNANQKYITQQMGNCGGADLNGDRKVDNLDITLVNNCYDLWKPECQKYDLNNDGKIDILDIAVVTDRFGETGCGCNMAQSDSSKGMCVSVDDKGCVFAISSEGKPFDYQTGKACWPSNMAQPVNNMVFHYKEGEIMGSNTPHFDIYERIWTNYHADWYSCVCENNVWVEAGDNSKERCEAGIGVAKTLTFLYPVPKNKWMNNFCCGDDCFEFYVAGSDRTSACCDNPDKVVIEGKCYVSVHDVSVEIEAPSTANTGEDVKVKSTIKNKGIYNENVEVKFSVDNIVKETKIISLSKDETKEVNFIWKAIEGIHNLFVKVFISSDDKNLTDKNLTDNEDSVQIKVTTPAIVYLCSDSDVNVEFPDGLNYFSVGKASLQVSPTTIRSYKDSCKNNPTDFFGDFDKNIGPGGGPVVKDKITPYLYEAVCENGKPAMKLHTCNCLNGKCVQ